MKKLMTLALAFVAAAAIHAADSYLRVDVNGAKDQVPLTAEVGQDLRATKMSWGKDLEKQKCTAIVYTKQKLSATEWKNIDFTLVPEKAGKISVGLMGQWAKTAENRGWVLVNNVKVNDKLFNNGDFKKTWKDKNGKTHPAYFWFNKNAKLLPEGGDKGTPAILVNHDNGAIFTLPVEAGKKYKVTVSVKAASADLAK